MPAGHPSQLATLLDSAGERIHRVSVIGLRAVGIIEGAVMFAMAGLAWWVLRDLVVEGEPAAAEVRYSSKRVPTLF